MPRQHVTQLVHRGALALRLREGFTTAASASGVTEADVTTGLADLLIRSDLALAG